MKANTKVSGIEKKWWVYFPIYSGGAGKPFDDEWEAYRFASDHRPAQVVLKANGLPEGVVARFLEEPSWHSGY